MIPFTKLLSHFHITFILERKWCRERVCSYISNHYWSPYALTIIIWPQKVQYATHKIPTNIIDVCVFEFNRIRPNKVLVLSPFSITINHDDYDDEMFLKSKYASNAGGVGRRAAKSCHLPIVVQNNHFKIPREMWVRGICICICRLHIVVLYSQPFQDIK